VRPRLRRAARPRSARHCGALGRRLTDARARGARAEGIQLAAADGIDWLLHIDTDELAYPGGAPEFSLQRVLAAYPADVDTVVFPNYESLPERDDVQDPFTEARPNPDSRMRRRSGPPARGIGTLAISANPTLTAGAQVTLFKRNYHHVVSDAYFKAYHTVARGNPNYFITYGNGKSAARVQSGLRPNGAHRWYSYVKAPKCAPTALALAITLNLQGAAADGRAGGAREETSDQAAVLHFTYNRFEDLKSRRDRCDCAPTEEDAKRCFILPFDRMARPAPLLAAAAAGFEVGLWGLMWRPRARAQAFLAASMRGDEELIRWFRERLVWNEPATVTDLLKNGLFVRLYEPQARAPASPAGSYARLASGQQCGCGPCRAGLTAAARRC